MYVYLAIVKLARDSDGFYQWGAAYVPHHVWCP